MLLAALPLLVALPPAPVAGLTPSACRVKNLDSAVTKRSLQKAVDLASAGDRLAARGV